MRGLGDLPIEMGPGEIAGLMNNPENIGALLLQEHDGTGDSPAEIMADIINVMRADTKKLAEAHGVEIEISMMPPERAAAVIAGVAHGDPVDLLDIFNELAEQREKILRAAIGDEDYEAFEQQKHAVMFTRDEE